MNYRQRLTKGPWRLDDKKTGAVLEVARPTFLEIYPRCVLELEDGFGS